MSVCHSIADLDQGNGLVSFVPKATSGARLCRNSCWRLGCGEPPAVTGKPAAVVG
jgi:hypothetical protein